jgi:hypothetical protein
VGQPLSGFELTGGRSLVIFRGVGGLVFPPRVCNSVDGVKPDQSVLEVRVEGKTAPGLVLGVIDQFSFQRIPMHVVELFDPLFQAPDIFPPASK